MTRLCLTLAVSLCSCVYVLKASSFEYLGCFQNFQGNISYTNITLMSSIVTDMSSIDCIEFCTMNKYTLASTSVRIIDRLFSKYLEGKCSCSNEIPALRVDEKLCNFTCQRNPDEKCDGTKESFFSVYGTKDKEIEETESLNLILVAVLVGSAVVIIFIIIVVSILCKRRCRKQEFQAVSAETPVSVNVKRGQFKVDVTEELRSGGNTLPNDYIRAEPIDSVIGEQELYEHLYEEPSDPKNNESKTTDAIYTNDISDKKYENTILAHIAMDEIQGKVDKNTSTPEVLEYEIPVQSPGVKDYYLKFDPADELEADINTREDEESGDEYEVMMPRKM